VDFNQLDEIAEPLTDHWAEKLGADVHELVSPVWEGSILPSLKAKARADGLTSEQFRDSCVHAIRLAVDLFDALHDNAHLSFTPATEKPRFYWIHQRFDILRTNDAKRGISIQKDALLGAASEYLGHPAIRTNKFDWLLLDAIVFAELDAFANYVMGQKWSTGLAATIADGHQPKYFAVLALFRVVGFAFEYCLMPALAYLAFARGHETTGWLLTGFWAFGLLWKLIGFPVRWKARRKNRELLTRLLDVYQLLGNSTISPRMLKDALDEATAAGVVLDGAVFSIVDRLRARDVTAFVPTQIG